MWVFTGAVCLLTGGREVEVIGTPEKAPDSPNQKGKTPPDHRVSCRALGEADHEGWLAKKGECGGRVVPFLFYVF